MEQSSTYGGYTLMPSSPARKCLDRFSICPPDIPEDKDGRVPFWAFLQALISAPISDGSSLVEQLETIAVTINDTIGVAGDYALLRSVLSQKPDFVGNVWPVLMRIALQMPDLFPSHNLPILNTQRKPQDTISLSRHQTSCLVIHQFLGTFPKPLWKDDDCYDFSIWLGSEQRHDKAPVAYLNALFRYFEKIVTDATTLQLSVDEWSIQYSLYSAAALTEISDWNDAQTGHNNPLSSLEVFNAPHYDTSPASLGLPGGAAVVSANRFIGFGQSASQEEVHVGISPEACPAVLLTPPLKSDEVLVIRGAQAMANVVGQRRDITSTEMPDLDTSEDCCRNGATGAWKNRTMLFMDALEIDLILDEGGLPDLLPANLEREIQKARLAFSSGGYSHVVTGLWGCGAFCGDPGVKMLALWYAASVAGGIPLKIICDPQLHAFGRELTAFAEKTRASGLVTAEGLRRLLGSAPLTLKRMETLQWFANNLPLVK